MTSPSKRKGNFYEREIVKQAQAMGLNSERAYASNGKSLGLSEKVDVVVNGVSIQAKRRKVIAKYINIPKDVDMVVIRQDGGESLAVVPFKKILELIKSGKWES